MGMSFSKLRRLMSVALALFSLLPLSPPVAAARRRSATARRSSPPRRSSADMARNIAPGAHVTSLLSPNTDPHEYEVRPRRREGAGVGRHRAALRRRGRRVARRRARQRGRGRAGRRRRRRGRRARGRRPALVAGPAARRAGGGARSAPRSPRAGLPDDSAAYVARLQRLDAGVRALHGPRARVRAQARHLPRRARLLRARATGSRSIGTVIPALTTAAQPSAGDVADARGDDPARGRQDDLRRELGQPEGRSGDRPRGRRADRPGAVGGLARPEGLDGATYIGSIEANTRALVAGLHGRRGRLPGRCLISRRPTSSAGSPRSCCWP